MCLFLFEIEVDDLGEEIVVGPGKKSLVLGVYSLSILAKEADTQMLVEPQRDSNYYKRTAGEGCEESAEVHG